MSDSIRDILPFSVGIAFILALLLLLVSLRLFRRSRTDVFWRRRRDAGRRGWRLFVLAFVFFGFSAVLCAATLLMTLVFDHNDTSEPDLVVSTGIQFVEEISPTPPDTAILPADQSTPPPNPTGTLSPAFPNNPLTTPPDTVVVIITTTPILTSTETPFPTFTPDFPPLQSSVTPLPGASIRITALDDEISDTFTPINPRTVFQPGTTRIYLFVEFSNMLQGVLWKRHLYRNGELIDGNAYLWGPESEGIAYFFFGNPDGLEPGDYEIRLFIGDSPDPVHVMPFNIP
jgi:hypothetical protein